MREKRGGVERTLSLSFISESKIELRYDYNQQEQLGYFSMLTKVIIILSCVASPFVNNFSLMMIQVDDR